MEVGLTDLSQLWDTPKEIYFSFQGKLLLFFDTMYFSNYESEGGPLSCVLRAAMFIEILTIYDFVMS
jgi:hypothetical protein